MAINQIVTPLDSAVLETKEQYKVYFKIVAHALNELVNSIEKENICTDAETTFVKQYCELLTYSLEAFRIKYLFDDDEKMRVDLTESGFPNYLEFRYLYNDLELKQEHVSKLPDVSKVKAEFLETLLKDKQPINDRKLHQAASVIYYSSVEKQFIYKRFVQGKILPVMGLDAEHMVSWSFYDVTANRPFICFMYFDLHKEKVEDVKGEIYAALENTADRNMDIDMMAYAIDKKLPYVFPKRIKKIDLGPLHSVFAKDELEVTHVILKAIIEKTFDLSAYAISVHIDEAVSTSEFKEGNFFNKQVLQVWEKSKAKNYLFCPHRVMQAMYDNIPETINALTGNPIEIPSLKLE
ncbi:hypothetical protein FEE95_05070 [Maribacter algarum]|uniref:Uncharacterized protein n=1 Tax=Maribacter algarum (ex Zhang et al. 2020) TaxID=2578118 RepID=A0A5S3PV13_9FLAO|nr:hypothetical protein [Maribacter algarum]TMM58803.1 hypothetical protein FEE95_05070 [Maribacter algarum]